jgi:hypothetical protein
MYFFYILTHSFQIVSIDSKIALFSYEMSCSCCYEMMPAIAVAVSDKI